AGSPPPLEESRTPYRDQNRPTASTLIQHRLAARHAPSSPSKLRRPWPKAEVRNDVQLATAQKARPCPDKRRSRAPPSRRHPGPWFLLSSDAKRECPANRLEIA